MDRDIAGAEATKQIREGLNQLKIKSYIISLPEGIHDINDYLVNDRKGFISFNSLILWIAFNWSPITTSAPYSILPDSLNAVKSI